MGSVPTIYSHHTPIPVTSNFLSSRDPSSMLHLPEPPSTKKKLVSLEESYEACRQVTAEYSKTF